MNFKRYYYMMMSGKPIKESMPILVYNYDGAEIETDSIEKIIDEVVGEILKEKRNSFGPPIDKRQLMLLRMCEGELNHLRKLRAEEEKKWEEEHECDDGYKYLFCKKQHDECMRDYDYWIDDSKYWYEQSMEMLRRYYEEKEKQAKNDSGKIIKIRPNREFGEV